MVARDLMEAEISAEIERDGPSFPDIRRMNTEIHEGMLITRAATPPASASSTPPAT
ncbi:MAG TPA: hypothetical protein VIH92_03710 [Solirubrobacteraceae bacterium]